MRPPPRLLSRDTLTFKRSSSESYLNELGLWVKAAQDTTFDTIGNMQPMDNSSLAAMKETAGVRISEAYFFFTQYEDIRPIDTNADQPDVAVYQGREFEVWGNQPWRERGNQITNHRKITLIRKGT